MNEQLRHDHFAADMRATLARHLGDLRDRLPETIYPQKFAQHNRLRDLMRLSVMEHQMQGTRGKIYDEFSKYYSEAVQDDPSMVYLKAIYALETHDQAFFTKLMPFFIEEPSILREECAIVAAQMDLPEMAVHLLRPFNTVLPNEADLRQGDNGWSAVASTYAFHRDWVKFDSALSQIHNEGLQGEMKALKASIFIADTSYEEAYDLASDLSPYFRVKILLELTDAYEKNLNSSEANIVFHEAYLVATNNLYHNPEKADPQGQLVMLLMIAQQDNLFDDDFYRVIGDMSYIVTNLLNEDEFSHIQLIFKDTVDLLIERGKFKGSKSLFQKWFSAVPEAYQEELQLQYALALYHKHPEPFRYIYEKDMKFADRLEGEAQIKFLESAVLPDMMWLLDTLAQDNDVHAFRTELLRARHIERRIEDLRMKMTGEGFREPDIENSISTYVQALAQRHSPHWKEMLGAIRHTPTKIGLLWKLYSQHCRVK